MFKAKEMFEKARQPKHGGHPTILARWYAEKKVPKFVGGAQHWRERNYALRSHRSWTTWLHSYTSWTTTERFTLGSSFECWGVPKTSSTATRICRRIKTMLENAKCSSGGNRTNSDTGTSTTSTASTTKSTIRRRRKLRSQSRSQTWMAVLQRATGKPADSIPIFIFNFAVADELELVAIYIIWEMVEISFSWKEFQKIDGECRQYTHKHRTYSAVQPVHKRGKHITRLAQGPARLKTCSVIFVRLNIVLSSCVLHMSHPWLLPHLPCTTSTSSSSHALFLLPRQRNTHYNRDNTIYSKNTQCISKHAWSKSIAIKNHSGVKISRVTETCATPSPQVMNPRSLRPESLRPKSLRPS